MLLLALFPSLGYDTKVVYVVTDIVVSGLCTHADTVINSP